MEVWTASEIQHSKGEMFVAIVTARDGTQLVAQCTTITFAKRIAWLHNHTAKFLLHITGTGDDSVEHYWPNDCDVCKEISSFLKTPPNNGLQPTPMVAPVDDSE